MTQVRLFKSDDGFTLVEVLVAMVILMIGMLGLLQSVNLAMETNLRSQLREEAALVGERAMNDLRGKGFDNISASYSNYQIASKLRGSGKNYTISRTAPVIATSNGQPATKELRVLVSWTYKGTTYQNRVVSPVSILR